MSAAASAFDPTTLAKYGRLSLIARNVVEGFLSGVHKSPYKGFSVEFAEHRQYYPGDEIRHIDWRVYGKTDRYYIKEHEEETNLHAHLLVDASGSMAYRGANPRGGISKFQYAQYLAASLAYLMLHQRDSVGLAVHDHQMRALLPPRSTSKQLMQILHTLEKTVPGGETNLAPIWDRLAGQIRARGMLLIFSDCFDQVSHLIHALRHLRHRRHEILLFHILAPEEIEFPFTQRTQFRHLEFLSQLRLVDPVAVRAAYLKNFDEFRQTLRVQASNLQIDYHLVRTDTPIDRALGAYLMKRQARRF
ncbi:MAG: DUF58 domain-containing protein [Planctomycetes bacterium]|nr:DUF58 domain-containing protein [Planctomycetota bacterium]